MITESYIRLILPTLLYFIYYYYFFFFQRRGDVGPSLVLRPSLRETTSGLPRSCCCCNTKSSWSSSGIKSVFIELSILFESSVPPDTPIVDCFSLACRISLYMDFSSKSFTCRSYCRIERYTAHVHVSDLL